jgi:hypothetical protein
MNVDALTNKPLPANAIQRILYLAPKVHIYQIPPATSTKGYQASTWTANDNKLQIFTARLRIVETSIPAEREDHDEKVSTTILLEDPKTGDLFAAAPYTSERIVEQALDSSRFFAITVMGEGRKASASPSRTHGAYSASRPNPHSHLAGSAQRRKRRPRSPNETLV